MPVHRHQRRYATSRQRLHRHQRHPVLRAGQTTAPFSVPILDDVKTEWPKTSVLKLGHPSEGAIRGTPNAAQVTIEASDQRPDLWVSSRPSTRYIGNNIYNTTGRHQTKSGVARRGHTRTFYARLYNDGLQTNTMTLTGTPSHPGSTVKYFQGTTEITNQVTSPAGRQYRIGRHSHRQIRIQVKVLPGAAIGHASAAG